MTGSKYLGVSVEEERARGVGGVRPGREVEASRQRHVQHLLSGVAFGKKVVRVYLEKGISTSMAQAGLLRNPDDVVDSEQ